MWRFLALLISTLALLAPAATAEGFCFWCLFQCPTDDSYGSACLRSVIPPWPICKFRTIPDFIEHAKESATRCCGDDLSDCKCPKKDTDKFMQDIGPWCQGVASCPSGDEPTEVVAEAEAADVEME